MALDEPGRGVLASENGPRTHTRTHAPTRERQAAGERRRVTARAWLFSDGVAIGV